MQSLSFPLLLSSSREIQCGRSSVENENDNGHENEERAEKPVFLPIPAIDLMSGQVVRLARGRPEEKKVYSDDPVAVALQFEAAGARRLHLIDLDGALSGEPANFGAVKAIRKAVTMEIELGGGLRTRGAVERVLEAGVNYAILGTAALRERAMLERLAGDVGDSLIVGIDARDGKVAVEGWTETSQVDAIDFARQLAAIGIGTFIATDIATDGMMTGPNLPSLVRLADAVTAEIIASGGVRHLDDLCALRDLGRPNVIGAITGRAIYEKTLDLAEAVRRLQPSAG
jgi:phosphoribosylformimino-5-aminoimidazole carboxamide ribotide isomerase